MTLRPAAIAHGGAESPNETWDGCRHAVDRALEVLEQSGSVLDAAQAGTVVLEDDPRYNAGTGARVRIDGETVQLDASMMDSRGKFGAVAALERVKNPILVAREVLEGPHMLLVGDGATKFARRLGHADYDPVTEDVRTKAAELRHRLLVDPPNGWRRYDWRRTWNYDRTLEELGLTRREVGTDTVGCAVRDADGNFAAALSTGGTAITLRGRVGDVPIYGAGLFAGPHGAVASTGDGERIIEAMLAKQTYDRLAAGASAQTAADEAVDSVRARGSIGVILLTREEMAAAFGTTMAWAGRIAGSNDWIGPPQR